MNVFLIILGIFAIIPISNFIAKQRDKRKEKKRKFAHYPKLIKQIEENHIQIDQLKLENNTLIYEGNKIKFRSNYLSEKLIDLESKINEITTELNNTKIENANLSNDLIQKDKKSIMFESKITEQNEQIVNLKEITEKITYELDNVKKQLKKSGIEVSDLRFELFQKDKENKLFENKLKEQHELFIAAKEKSNDSISKITSLYSDFLLLEYDIIASHVENKKRPAIEEGKRIRELKIQSKMYLEQYSQMLYKYEYLLNIFPELSNYVDDFDTLKQLDEANSIEDFIEDFDNVQKYLSKEEYFDLNENMRNQLALDRYVKGKKTSWQIGRDYELFCGLSYEKKGWEVDYFGMEKRLKDLGRDLIAKKGNEVEIIQCKLWREDRIIHEKHILQLYGTTMIDKLTNPDLFKKVTPVFITNTTLSETAQKFAKILGVRIEKLEMKEFPRIKCNIGFDEYGIESKIYHLPFDQHYDRTKIKKGKGFFASDVQEAMEQGFRRSYRYYGR